MGCITLWTVFRLPCGGELLRLVCADVWISLSHVGSWAPYLRLALRVQKVRTCLIRHSNAVTRASFPVDPRTTRVRIACARQRAVHRHCSRA